MNPFCRTNRFVWSDYREARQLQLNKPEEKAGLQVAGKHIIFQLSTRPMSHSYDYLNLSCLDTHPACDDDEQDNVKTTQQVLVSMTSSHKRQQRYREKQRKYENDLEITVKRLRMNVDQLIELHCTKKAHNNDENLAPCQSNNMTMADVVILMRERMEAFESGEQANQTMFLDSVMRSDVENGNYVKRHSILEQWQHFAQFAIVLEECVFTVDFLEKDLALGHVSAMLVLQRTRWNLATIFPFTLTSARLRNKFLQYPVLRLPMTVFFQFDEQGKVSRYDPTIDFVPALYRVLNDYQDVVSMLKSANINASGQIRGNLPPTETSRPGTINSITAPCWN